MEAGAPLIERGVAMLGCRRADHDAGAPANAIEHVRRIVLNPHAEGLVKQPVIKVAAGSNLAHRELNVGDAIDVDDAPYDGSAYWRALALRAISVTKVQIRQRNRAA